MFTQEHDMKIKLLFLTLFIFTLAISAQQIDGTYINGKDSIVFNNNSVSFSITEFAGLFTVQVGEGSYEFADEYLLVHTTDYTGERTTFSAEDASKKDTCIVKIVNMNNYAEQGILLETKNSSGKVLSASVTSSNGIIFITDFNKVSRLSVSAMGYNSITFDFDPTKDFTVKIAKNDIIQNRTVAFKFKEIDENTITLLLLSDDLKKGKDLNKELEKLNKRAKKVNLVEKRYTKALPYFTR